MCRCQGGIDRPRCQHYFSYVDIVNLRSKYRLKPVVERIDAMAKKLQKHPENQKKQSAEGERRHHCTYFLGDRQVCRGFFRRCLGISDEEVTKISQTVRMKEPTQRLKTKNPTYKEDDLKVNECKA